MREIHLRTHQRMERLDSPDRYPRVRQGQVTYRRLSATAWQWCGDKSSLWHLCTDRRSAQLEARYQRQVVRREQPVPLWVGSGAYDRKKVEHYHEIKRLRRAA